MVREGGKSSRRSGSDPVDCRLAIELLKAGQYERVVEMLRAFEDAATSTVDTILVHVLDAARRICLACEQCQAESEWHLRAYHEAVQREHALRRQLHTILDLIDERTPPGEPGRPGSRPSLRADEARRIARGPPLPAKQPPLWQRLRALFGFLGPRRGEIPTALVEGADPFPADRGGLAAALLPMPEPKAPPLVGSVLDGSPAEKPPLPTAPLVEPQHDELDLGAPERPSTELSSAAKAGSTLLPQVETDRERAVPSLAVYCLGTFRVYSRGQLVEGWTGRKCKSVFKYLIMHDEQPVCLEVLMDAFWPDADPDSARRNLYQAIYSLRRALQANAPDVECILYQDGCYSLDPCVQMWVDSEAFTRHYQAGLGLQRVERMGEAVREYEAADNIYQGEFLPEDRYAEWSQVSRENLRHMHLDIMHRLSQYYYDQGQFGLCITFCQKLLVEDSCREDAHRLLMRCHLGQGRRHLAMRQYHLCVETLRERLDVSPMPATTALYQQIQKDGTLCGEA